MKKIFEKAMVAGGISYSLTALKLARFFSLAILNFIHFNIVIFLYLIDLLNCQNEDDWMGANALQCILIIGSSVNEEITLPSVAKVLVSAQQISVVV